MNLYATARSFERWIKKDEKRKTSVQKKSTHISCELNQLDDDDDTIEKRNERDPSSSAERRDQEEPSWCCNDAQSALARHIFLKSDSGC